MIWAFGSSVISSQVFFFPKGKGVNLVCFFGFWLKLKTRTGGFLVLENRN